MGLPDALARFLVQLQADGRSPHTVARYARHVAAFVEWASARVSTKSALSRPKSRLPRPSAGAR
jgi:hypothetical protein